MREERGERPSHLAWDLLVLFLAGALVAFLAVTMSIRTRAAELEAECQARLRALAQAQQLYLAQHSKYTTDLEALQPFLEPRLRRNPLLCPVTGLAFTCRVQGDRYRIVAPGTAFFIDTGDPSW
jgi:type II secretory pathway pseudopilin PulG